MLEIIIPGEPCAQGRPRFARRGKFVTTYDPAKSRNWKATAQQHMLAALARSAPDVIPGNSYAIGPAEGPLSVEIAATFTCPKSDHRKRDPVPRRWHAKRPDAENVAKAVLDAGTGVLWLDDSQIAHLVVVKAIGAQGEAPRVWLKVSAVREQPA